MGLMDTQLIAMERQASLFEEAIRKMETPTCKVFMQAGEVYPVVFEETELRLDAQDLGKLKEAFPHTFSQSQNRILRACGVCSDLPKNKRVAVLFSGGPAPGGHNVIAGLGMALGASNTLLGVKAGPKGLLEGNLFEIEKRDLVQLHNTGGFDFLGSDRTKIKTPKQFEAVKKTCSEHQLDGVVIVGGDDSNTNAAVLAEVMYPHGVQIVGVPKTIDGDLQAGNHLPISFGFDTAAKIYAEMVGNILQDTPSSRKYWHFIKLMGRSASHIALEVALQTHPAVCFISEEVSDKKMSLDAIVEDIVKKVERRSQKAMHHGVVIIPEGLIEFIPEMQSLISALNEKMASFHSDLSEKPFLEKKDFLANKLKQEDLLLFESLPLYIQEMLLLERDSHGNLQVSQIPTERLLMDMVKQKLKAKAPQIPFSTQSHFFGYEGRCGAPSLFDAAYCLNLGLTAGSIILAGKTGYMAAMTDFESGGEILAIPLTGLMHVERRHGLDERVIKKALVDLDLPAFKYFESRREHWSSEDLFSSPGPRQLWGPVSNQIPISVALNQGYSSLQFKL